MKRWAKITGRTLCYAVMECPLVREGAVYGLAPHVTDPGMRDVLEAITVDDPSPGVRDAAREAQES